MKHKRLPQSGFTLIELLIATGVFSLILMLLTTGLVQMGRMYTKGLITTRTQEAARSLADDVANNARFGGGYIYVLTPVTYGAAEVKGYCVGNSRYSYREGVKAVGGVPAVVTDTVGVCNQNVKPLDITQSLQAGDKELLPQRMQIPPGGFALTQPASGSLVILDITVASGDADVDLELGPPTRCKSGPGTQFCAVSTLSTAITSQVGVR